MWGNSPNLANSPPTIKGVDCTHLKFSKVCLLAEELPSDNGATYETSTVALVYSRHS